MTSECQHLKPLECFSAAEARAIEVHKYYLSQQAGYDVGLQYAVDHWVRFHAQRWRKRRLCRELELQREEIKKHRWIESERAGIDLGQKAERDWIERYAAIWRQWCEHQVDW